MFLEADPHFVCVSFVCIFLPMVSHYSTDVQEAVEAEAGQKESAGR